MSNRLRVVFCWTEVSGYMAACWRALADQPDIDLHIIHLKQIGEAPNPFDVDTLMQGMSHQVIEASQSGLDAYLSDAVAARDPHVLVVCGWLFWPYTGLLTSKRFAHVGKILGMDSPWRGTAKQRLAKLRLGPVLSKLDLVVVANDRTAEYARRLGVSERRVRTGYYGCNYQLFAEAGAARPHPRPRQFVCAARYAPEKNFGTLISAYRTYRVQAQSPWGLTCVGTGPDRALLDGVDGVTDRGFVQPADLPALFANHGAFVLPSIFEPWGVAIVEAAASGLPIICSSACGAVADVVRPYYNGLVVAADDVAALTRALHWIDEHEPELDVMGQRGQELANAFSAQAWATWWREYAIEVTAQ